MPIANFPGFFQRCFLGRKKALREGFSLSAVWFGEVRSSRGVGPSGPFPI